MVQLGLAHTQYHIPKLYDCQMAKILRLHFVKKQLLDEIINKNLVSISLSVVVRSVKCKKL